MSKSRSKTTKTAKKSTPDPSIALVCDWLTTPGGAEKVLLELHQMYPDAPIYTSQYRPKKIAWFNTAIVRTGWLNLFPACLRKLLGPLRALYFSHLDLSHYDLVISVTGAEAKAVKTNYHICYCHVPTQYYWQMYDQYIKNPGFGFLNPLVRLALKCLIKPLRQADFRAAQRPDQFVTISSYAAAQIKQFYHRDAKIIAPPVDISRFSPFSTTSPQKSTRNPQEIHQKSELLHKNPQEIHKKSTKNPNFSTKIHIFSTFFPQLFHRSTESTPTTVSRNEPYFVISCRQVTWKRVDLAIKGCILAQKRLVVIGDGPEHHHLETLATPLIHFIPWLDAKELSQYLQSATAYIFPSLEPFGIAAVEALAAGCPVIAYKAGGSQDIIQPGKNGLFFAKQTPESLAKALKSFQSSDYSRSAVSSTATKFSSKHFRSNISQLVSAFSEQSSKSQNPKPQEGTKL